MGTKNYNNYSDMITFTRASTGTYLDSDGVLKSATTNTPRVEYDYQGNRLGLLVEEARTNLITNSLSFSPFQGIGAAASTETAPDGSTDATLVTAGGNGAHRVKISVSTTTATGVAYVVSVFVKNVDANYVQILNGGDANYVANFDLINEAVGTTGSATTSTITKYPNGWYRLTALYDGTGTLDVNNYIYITASASAAYGQAANNPGAQMHLWGAQLEQGTFPTSYIPTSGATATRSADVASIGVGAFGYNKTAGSVVVQTRTETVDQWIVGIAYFNTASFLNSRGFVKSNAGNTSGGNRYLFTSYDGASTVVNLADANTGQSVKLGAAWKDSENAVVDGGTVQAGTIRNPAPTDLRIGGRENGFQSRCHISSIAYYPRRLTDAQIKALTSPPETPTLSLTFDDSTTSYLETSIHG